QAYIKGIDTFNHDVSFFTVKISSTNTEHLQNFLDKDEFSMLCQALTALKKQPDVTVPMYLKLTSDMDLDGLKSLLPAITET
ncbi:dihydroorotate dehydrogenase (quinone), partial [Staphylococcus aureus]